MTTYDMGSCYGFHPAERIGKKKFCRKIAWESAYEKTPLKTPNPYTGNLVNVLAIRHSLAAITNSIKRVGS